MTVHPKNSPDKLEEFLDEKFGEKSRIDYSPKLRRSLVRFSPSLALLSATGCILFAVSFWHMGSHLEESAATYLETPNLPSSLGIMWYITFVGLLAIIALLVWSIPGLARRKHRGWRHALYAALATAALGVCYLFVPGFGFANVFGSLVLGVLATVSLMQIRSYFRL